MLRRNMIRGIIHISCYVAILVGLVVVGYAIDKRSFHASSYAGGVGGGGIMTLTAPQNNVTWEFQFRPGTPTLDYVRYDLSIQELNYTSLYLRINVGDEEGSINPTNVTARLETLFNQKALPLVYNVSRGEYVTLFDLEPDFTGLFDSFQVNIMVNCSSPPSIKIFTVIYPFNINLYVGQWSAGLLCYGLIFVVNLAILINLMGRYRSIQKQHHEDQALLAQLRQQNRGAYDTAVQQLQTDHYQLLQQVQKKNQSGGGSPDA